MNGGDVDRINEYAAKMTGWFCRHYSLRRHQREDVLQDMLVGISQATSRYNANRGVSFETFARKRMYGEAIDGLARRGGIPRSQWAKGVRGPKSLIEEISSSSDSRPADDSESNRDIAKHLESLKRISPLLRHSLEQAYVEKSHVADIAREIGLTETNVRQLLLRGLQLLRHMILREKSHNKEPTMESSRVTVPFSPAAWQNELRRTVRKLVTPEVIQQLVQSQIELAKAGDRHALTFLMKQCGFNGELKRARSLRR